MRTFRDPRLSLSERLVIRSFRFAEDMATISDREVLAHCTEQGSILLTLDKDFGELVFRRSLPATNGVILFRIHTQTLEEFVETVLAVIRSREEWAGHFSVVTKDRIRMTPTR